MHRGLLDPELDSDPAETPAPGLDRKGHIRSHNHSKRHSLACPHRPANLDRTPGVHMDLLEEVEFVLDLERYTCHVSAGPAVRDRTFPAQLALERRCNCTPGNSCHRHIPGQRIAPPRSERGAARTLEADHTPQCRTVRSSCMPGDRRYRTAVERAGPPAREATQLPGPSKGRRHCPEHNTVRNHRTKKPVYPSAFAAEEAVDQSRIPGILWHRCRKLWLLGCKHDAGDDGPSTTAQVLVQEKHTHAAICRSPGRNVSLHAVQEQVHHSYRPIAPLPEAETGVRASEAELEVCVSETTVPETVHSTELPCAAGTVGAVSGPSTDCEQGHSRSWSPAAGNTGSSRHSPALVPAALGAETAAAAGAGSGAGNGAGSGAEVGAELAPGPGAARTGTMSGARLRQSRQRQRHREQAARQTGRTSQRHSWAAHGRALTPC